jgi:hypothetical protein
LTNAGQLKLNVQLWQFWAKFNCTSVCPTAGPGADCCSRVGSAFSSLHAARAAVSVEEDDERSFEDMLLSLSVRYLWLALVFLRVAVQ